MEGTPISPHLRFSGAAQILALAAVACSSSLDPRAGVTLHVFNGTCTPGPCTTLEVLAFPGNQPRTPGGYWWLDLRTMTGPEACVIIPDTATFLVIGINANNTADTTKYVWTNAMGLELSAQIPEFLPAPSTSIFVPAGSGGWQIKLPGESRVTASGACTP